MKAIKVYTNPGTRTEIFEVEGLPRVYVTKSFWRSGVGDNFANWSTEIGQIHEGDFVVIEDDHSNSWTEDMKGSRARMSESFKAFKARIIEIANRKLDPAYIAKKLNDRKVARGY